MNWKDFFDRLGMNGTRWQWRMLRWEQAWKERGSTWGQQRRQVLYRHKFCACGALMDRDERVCPACGRRAPSWRAQVVRRSVGLVTPSALAVSAALLAVNTAVYLLVVLIAGAEALFAPPMELLARMGGLVLSSLPDRQYGLLITYGYLHFGLIHFGFNMLVLSQVGPMLEQEIGKARFFTLYTLALVGGGLARYVVSGPVNTIVVGASGALFGLIGFGLAYAHATGTRQALALRDFFARWALYGFLFGFFVGADNVAHLGGFVVGVALGLLVERERAGRERFTPVWGYAAAACLLATVAAFGWVLARGLAGS
jgi:rhomboid protease GluP